MQQLSKETLITYSPTQKTYTIQDAANLEITLNFSEIEAVACFIHAWQLRNFHTLRNIKLELVRSPWHQVFLTQTECNALLAMVYQHIRPNFYHLPHIDVVHQYESVQLSFQEGRVNITMSESGNIPDTTGCWILL